MAITFSEKKRIFTIQTSHTTYQMMADRRGSLLHLYYGARTPGEMDYLLTYADRGFSGSPYDAGNDRCYSLDFLPQEFPTYGTGDFRSPALVVEYEGGLFGCDLRFDSYEISDGKYGINGLPAVYASESEAQSLKITLRDEAAHVAVDLLYGVLPELDIITRAAVVRNIGGAAAGAAGPGDSCTGSESAAGTGSAAGGRAAAGSTPAGGTGSSGENCAPVIHITRALSANLDFVSGDFDLITFHGRHAMERNLQREPLGHGEYTIGSRRGTSSHQYNPLMILAEKNATETAGTCYAMEFVYSGEFTASAGVDQFGGVRMQMGLNDRLFRYPVKGGESFTMPEVIMSCSTQGLSRLSASLQDCIRKHVIRGPWRDRIRPVLLNSWEGCYFDFNEEKILNMARGARDLGLDMFVLDDGWFGARNSDNAGLGDWFVNTSKIGDFHDLVSKIHDMGLLFGLWFEPEMVNEDSGLYRAHPDWALTLPGRDPVRGRNQLVLDFSRKEVIDCIFDMTSKIIDMGPVDYVKWDYNRSISEVYSRSGRDTGTVLYDYVLGLYDFLERLNRRYPDLLIEGCSGGGGRFDAGMLYYTPQIWCSDNSDAIDRLRIQYGTSFGYPASAMGAHVSVSPNEQCGRVTPLETRTVVAMSGTFGYELDPAKLSEEEKEQIRKDVKRQKKLAPLIFSGDYFRLTSPFDGHMGAWEFVSKDGSEVLVNIVTLEVHGNMTPQYVRLQGLDPDAQYILDDTGAGGISETRDKSNYGDLIDSRTLNTAGKTGIVCGGGALMQAGLPLPSEFGEYHAYQWHFTKV